MDCILKIYAEIWAFVVHENNMATERDDTSGLGLEDELILLSVEVLLS